MKKIQCDWMEGYNKRNKLVKLEAKVYKDFFMFGIAFLPLQQWKFVNRGFGICDMTFNLRN